MKIKVEVYESLNWFDDGGEPLAQYVMNHNSTEERRVLGQQCRNAFEGGQLIVTYSVKKEG